MGRAGQVPTGLVLGGGVGLKGEASEETPWFRCVEIERKTKQSTLFHSV